MHHPAAALTWELWRRHRNRLMMIGGLLAGFALVYPKLCALAGFDLNSSDALTEVSRKFNQSEGPGALRILQSLYFLCLACSPVVTMFLSLLYLVWMFTLTANDPKTKDPMKFPERLFTLPVSTTFLYGWLLAGGMTLVIVLYTCWIQFVRLPQLEMFKVYQNCFGWLTLLALAQGISWALAAWPLSRMLLLMAVLFGFSCSPARRDIFESPMVLPSFFAAGVLLAATGLQKMRHGQWQGWTWQWVGSKAPAGAKLRGPERFASPAQAQLWFEWRRFARRLCCCVAGLALVPVALQLLVRFTTGRGPLQEDTLAAFAVCLLSLPVFIHFCFATSPARSDLPFLMLRPQTNGALMMAAMKVAAISTAISWLAVFLAMGGLTLLGDFSAVLRSWAVPPELRIVMAVGMVFLTWHLIAANLCFAWSGKRWMANVPTLGLISVYAGVFVLSILRHDDAHWNLFLRCVPGLLLGLVVVKFLLAIATFRVSLQRRLLAPSAVIRYLIVWCVLAAALLATLAMLTHLPREWMLSASLGVVLLVPLARVGFCPVALSWNRHN